MMNDRNSRLSVTRSPARRSPLSSRFSPVSHLRRLRGCEQVAAVCYRIRNGGIEFLLVQTRGRHWTFPKGGVEPGLTHAQAAALEAFEEAGVHGRMEESSFTQYTRHKPDSLRRSSARPIQKEPAVNAHLCEVRRLGPPQESDRNRTWFSPEKAKQYLKKGRTAHYGTELARVVDRALTRIRRLQDVTSAAAYVLENRQEKDALQKVRFEAFSSANIHSPMAEIHLARHVRHVSDATAGVTLTGNHPQEILQINRPAANDQPTRLRRLPASTNPITKLKSWPSEGKRSGKLT